jgi:hypothetical protein
MTSRPALSVLLFIVATALPVSLAGQQAAPTRPTTPALRPAISQWETARVPALNGVGKNSAAAAVAGPDLTSEWVAIVVVAVVLAVVVVRVARN